MRIKARKMWGDPIELEEFPALERAYLGSDGRIYLEPEDQDLLPVREDERLPWDLTDHLGEATLYEVWFVPLKSTAEPSENDPRLAYDWEEAVSLFELSISGNHVDSDADPGELVVRAFNAHFPITRAIVKVGPGIFKGVPIGGWDCTNFRLYGPSLREVDEAGRTRGFYGFSEVDWEATARVNGVEG